MLDSTLSFIKTDQIKDHDVLPLKNKKKRDSKKQHHHKEIDELSTALNKLKLLWMNQHRHLLLSSVVLQNSFLDHTRSVFLKDSNDFLKHCKLDKSKHSDFEKLFNSISKLMREPTAITHYFERARDSDTFQRYISEFSYSRSY